MVIDSSAVVGVLMREADAERLLDILRGAVSIRMSAATFLEASIVMARYHGAIGIAEVDRFLDAFAVSIEHVTVSQAQTARAAYLRFGKGRHPAALNFGDCFSYALASERDEELLFVGADFARADIRIVAG